MLQKLGEGMGVRKMPSGEKSANKKTKEKKTQKKGKIAHKIDDKPFQIIFSSLTLWGPGSRVVWGWKVLAKKLRGIPNSTAQDFGRGNTLKSEGKMMNYLLPLSLGVKVSPDDGGCGRNRAMAWPGKGRDGSGLWVWAWVWMGKNIKTNAQPKQTLHGRWNP